VSEKIRLKFLSTINWKEPPMEMLFATPFLEMEMSEED